MYCILVYYCCPLTSAPTILLNYSTLRFHACWYFELCANIRNFVSTGIYCVTPHYHTHNVRTHYYPLTSTDNAALQSREKSEHWKYRCGNKEWNTAMHASSTCWHSYAVPICVCAAVLVFCTFPSLLWQIQYSVFLHPLHPPRSRPRPRSSVHSGTLSFCTS